MSLLTVNEKALGISGRMLARVRSRWRGAALIAIVIATSTVLTIAIMTARYANAEVRRGLEPPSPSLSDIGVSLVRAINRLQEVTTKSVIRCPPLTEARTGAVLATGRGSQQPLDLNRATEIQLQSLPGVGPAKAKRIVKWRQRRGPFRRIRDLRRVKGFGRKSLHRLRPFVSVTKPK